jgi:hypothetical protein
VTGVGAPVPPARLAVRLAARVLPTGAARERYAAEFLAELYGLTPADQLRYATGVLSTSLALRAALGASHLRATAEAPMDYTTTLGQRLRCRYLRWHHWQAVTNPDGERYVACSVCHKEHTGWDSTPRNILGGMAG